MARLLSKLTVPKSHSHPSSAKPPAARHLQLEALEDRRLLAVTPELININSGTADADLSSVAYHNGLGFFSVTGSSAQSSSVTNLWKTDGTSGGTVQFSPFKTVDTWLEVAGTFFVAGDQGPGTSLYRTDGTPAGTVHLGFFSSPDNFTNVNGILYFTGKVGTYGTELFKSDGTVGGTQLVKDIRPGTDGSKPIKLTNVNGTLFFTVDEGLGAELWKSDGTAAGTVMVKDINPGSAGSSPSSLTAIGGTLYFTATASGMGRELWKSDGTEAGTVPIELSPGGANTSFGELVNFNGTLFFTTGSGGNGFELWKSNGTLAGTSMVIDLLPGSGSSSPNGLLVVGNELYFAANDGTFGSELWKTDGSAIGTVRVTDINPGAASSTPGNLTNVNGVVYFTADDGVHGNEVWRTDASPGGAVLLRDVWPGSWGSSPTRLSNVNGTLYFVANDLEHGRELWKTDGTSLGTSLVKDINLGDAGDSSPTGFTEMNGFVYFAASRSVPGLWKTDSTAAGTVLLKDQLTVSSLVNVNGMLYFTGNDGTTGAELWKSDGTPQGTVRVKDIRPGVQSSDPKRLFNLNGTLIFEADDGTLGRELWKSDGTEAGTQLLLDIQPGPGSSLTEFGASVGELNGELFFSANPGTGYKLWKTDGTTAGTVQVKDLGIGGYNGPSIARSFTNLNGVLLFAGATSATSFEWWKSDGTTVGTTKLLDSGNLRAAGSAVKIGDWVYLSAIDDDSGSELWKTDGTSAGTVLVKDIRPGSAGSSPTTFTNVNGTLFFSANDGTTGAELWKSDGTSAGTVLVADILPGATGSLLGGTQMANVNGVVYFSARNIKGIELWKSDGTPGGTLVHDMLPGAEHGTVNPPLFNSQGTLLFAATNGVHGRELWVIRPTKVSLAPAAAQHETDSGTTPFVFTISLSDPVDLPVTVAFATSDGTATLADGDYSAASGTLTFAPGQTEQLVTVWVSGDTEVEADETFMLILSDPINAVLGATTQATGTIFNDDAYNASVVGRHIFYNQSKFDGNSAAINAADDAAIASDKVAYLPGSGLATFANTTSYSRGINGIMIDIAGNHGPLSAADFTFKMGTNNTPSAWAAAPAPSAVVVRPGAGTGGADRVEITWANNAIQNTWLYVTVEGNDAVGGFNTNTGLSASDRFFFGNLVGNSGLGDGGIFFTSSTDDLAARLNPGVAGITNPFDYNRDGFVTPSDQLIARQNSGALTKLNVASPPAAPLASEDDGSGAAVASALALLNSESGAAPPVATSDWQPRGSVAELDTRSLALRDLDCVANAAAGEAEANASDESSALEARLIDLLFAALSD